MTLIHDPDPSRRISLRVWWQHYREARFTGADRRTARRWACKRMKGSA